MASPVCELTAHGIASEQCSSCQRNFARGEKMTSFEDSDGDPLGWVCQSCIDDWRENGEESKTAKSLFNSN